MLLRERGCFRKWVLLSRAAKSVALVAVFALAEPSTGWAQEEAAATPDAEAVATAREAYRRGETLYESGRFAEAEEEFQEAFRLIHNPVVLLSIAECQERDQRGAAAALSLRRYLMLRPDAPDAESVGARIAAIQERPGVLRVTSEPAGATVEINGEVQEQTTPARFELPPRDYRVVVRRDGLDPVAEQVFVEFATEHELALTLPAEGEGIPIAPRAPVVAARSEVGEAASEATHDDGVPTSVWVATGVAGAGLVAGTVLGFLALSKQADFDDAPSDATADDGETLALFSDLSFGVGAAAAATALVLYLTKDESSEDETVSLSPVVAPATLGATGQVRF